MRIMGYIMLHYGSEYLDAAIRSIYDVCDDINILYSGFPTHQYIKGIVCPDSEESLKAIARNAGRKVHWFNVNKKGNLSHEYQHLAKAWQFCGDCDMMLRIDSDEVWEPESLKRCIELAKGTDSQYIGIYGFVNFWRSFDHVVLDRFGPIRIHNMRSRNKTPAFLDGTIYHFGYAVKPPTMEYKMKIHGHKDEFRKGWYDRWLTWRPGTLGENWHPVTDAYWHTIDVFNKDVLPAYMKEHPYYNLNFIE